jgi:hypothetical protein
MDGTDWLGRRRPLQFRDPLQRCASQALRLTPDGFFSLAFHARYSPIECGNELTQVADEGLV